MKKYFIGLVAIAVAAVACTKEVSETIQEEQIGKRHITVLTDTPSTRTVLDDDHNALLWTAGDNFRLMTNTTDESHDAQTLNYTEGGKFEVEVSADATEAYAYYFAGEYEDSNHSTPTAFTSYIEHNQTQTRAGVLNGQMLPMAAKGTITENNTVSLKFHQMAGVMALNIYSTSKVEGEVINSVKVTPTANTNFCGAMSGTDLTVDDIVYSTGSSNKYPTITVQLDEAYDYASSKPDDKKMFGSQIYVVLAKQSYSAVKFEIQTNKRKLEITSSGVPIDLTSNDFYPVNINLAKTEEVVVYEESFASDQGAFSLEGTSGTWTHGSYNNEGYMQAKKANSTAWLVSPVLSIQKDDAKLSFSQAINKYVTNASEELTVWVREVGGDWEQLTGFGYPTVAEGQSFSSFESAEVTLAKNNKYVQIGFKYVSSNSYGTWEIKDFKVTNAVLVQQLAFTVTTESPILVPADPGTDDVYQIVVEADDDVVWTAEVIEGDEDAIALSETEFVGSGVVEMIFDSNTGGSRNWKIMISTEAFVATSTFTVLVSQDGSASGWVKTSLADLTLSDVFVIVGNDGTTDYAISNDKGTSNAPSAVSVTVVGDELSGDIAENIKWNVSGNTTNGYTFYPNGNTATWLYCSTTAATGSNNNIRVGTGDRNVFELNNAGQLVTKDDYVVRYLSIYSTTPDWRGYINTTTAPTPKISFYKYDDGKLDPGIAFTPSEATITYGDILTQPTLTNTHNLPITFASSHTNVATVSSTGEISVLKAGSTTITATWEDTEINGVTYRGGSAPFALVVKKVATTVEFNNPTTTVSVNGNVTNVATVTPNTLTVTYTSSKPEVATVDETGNVIGIADGKATITASFAGNENYAAASDSYEITVGTGGDNPEGKTVSVIIGDYAAANDWENDTYYSTVVIDENITATANKSGNTGKYYTSGEQWRFYQNNNGTLTISAKEGIIKTVKVTYSPSNNGVFKNGSTTVLSNEVFTVNSESVEFTVGNSGTATNGQARVTAITVSY